MKILRNTWKDVVGYEGMYSVSNYGDVKSLMRKVKCRGGGYRTLNERVLKQDVGTGGYLTVNLRNGKSGKTSAVHRLVYQAFTGHVPSSSVHIDHDDDDRLNNRLDNLKLLSVGANISKGHKNTASGQRGVYKAWKKWEVKFTHKGRRIYLGSHELNEAIKISKNYIKNENN